MLEKLMGALPRGLQHGQPEARQVGRTWISCLLSHATRRIPPQQDIELYRTPIGGIVTDMANRAYYGGRFEAGGFGHLKGRYTNTI